MIKTNALSGIVGVALLLLAAAVFAQQPATVGDLLDKGGRKLTKEELSVLLTGAIVSGTQASTGAKYINTLNADGSVTGNVMGTQGQALAVSGKWNLNDQGQQCWDLLAGRGANFGGCSFYFVLDNAYYASSRETRGGPLSVREIKKK